MKTFIVAVFAGNSLNFIGNAMTITAKQSHAYAYLTAEDALHAGLYFCQEYKQVTFVDGKQVELDYHYHVLTQGANR